MNRFFVLKCVIVALAIGTATRASAAPIQFTIDTSSLNSGDTYTFAAALTDGDPSATNTATISGIGFGAGGAAVGNVDCTLGSAAGTGCSGDLASGVTLTDAGLAPDILTGFFQQFTPGTTLSFLLDTTNVHDPASVTPDQLAFYLYTFTPAGDPVCPSTDPACTLVTLDLLGGPIASASFTVTATLPTRIESLNPVPVPEPATLVLTGGGLAIAALRRRRREGASS